MPSKMLFSYQLIIQLITQLRKSAFRWEPFGADGRGRAGMALGRLRADAMLHLWVAVPAQRYPVIKCVRRGSQELQVLCPSV